MEEKRNNNRERKVTIRFTDAEYNKVMMAFQATTKRKVSEYIRAVLLDKPVTVYTRNQSIDDLMTELAKLRYEFSAIGNNFNQLVKKLHSLEQTGDIKWLVTLTEKEREKLGEKATEINQKITQISDQWLQE